MAWKVEKSADGLPMWSGTDSIYNVLNPVNSDNRRDHQIGNRASIVFSTILGAIFGFLSLGVITISWEGGILGAVVGGGIAAYARRYVAIKTENLPEWLGDSWLLNAQTDGLNYKGAESWAVDLKSINRVETSPTSDWQKARTYPQAFGDPKNASIPPAEYQTFLVLWDTSRRVIYTANADREGCSTLAHSIRSFLETVQPSEPAPAASGAPIPPPAGFEL